VDVTETKVPGSWVFSPRQFPDERGRFLEYYKADVVASVVGHRLALAQANHSVSRAGVLRGIHYADVPPSQAKYVYCPAGAFLDFVIDIRVGSPTFGAWDCVRLDDVDRRGIYIAEGLGHAAVALQDNSSLMYLCSTPYTPEREHTVLATDPELGIDWGTDDPLLSPRDAAAPTLGEARAAGALPAYDECVALYDRLRQSGA
jgi:dTDP-4-dehydrorhamnose 3,5-epimerase